MKKVLFMLGKDPKGPSAGDVVMSRLVMDLARASFGVRGIALRPGPSGIDGEITYVPKPKITKLSLVTKSLKSNRSLIHSRFDTPDLRAFLLEANFDRFVAEHSYMAESFIQQRGQDAATRLIVNTHVPESLVLRGTHGSIMAPEASRTARDERRVAASARAVGSFDDREAQACKARRSLYLSVTLPPAVRVDTRNSDKSLVFVGDMSWAPNRSALTSLIDAWPSIRAAVPDAELRLIGKGTVEFAQSAGPGIRGLGYVPDLQEELLRARALIAPITVGGGVRVKILEAVAIGLPVIGSRSAVGTLDTFLPLEVSESSHGIIDRSVRLLLDAKYAASQGAALYEKNFELWRAETHHRLVADWIGT